MLRRTVRIKMRKHKFCDFSRTCEGCEFLRTELWPVKGSYSEMTIAFRCFAPGMRQGYHMGTTYLFCYVPAWCPKAAAKEGRVNGRAGQNA